MTAATLVTCVLTKLKKVFNIVVPGLKISAARATAFATLVYRNELVVVEFEEWNNSL